jgi:ankyrin repeat protein
MAAASRGQATAVQRLLELGADPREDHLLYGSALHVAAQSGSPETVRLLLAAGIPPGLKNRQGFTPRALIQAARNQIDMTRKMVKTMPHLQKVYDQLGVKLADLPEAGWAACEELLRQAGG